MVRFSKHVLKVQIDNASDSLYFLKDQTSHYIKIQLFFKKGEMYVYNTLRDSI